MTTEAIQTSGAELPAEFIAYSKIIENAATNPEVDVDKLQKLMEMQIAIMDRAAKMQFNAAMAVVQSAVPPVVADKVNLHTKSKYPSLENVQTSIKDIYLANGFTCTFAEGDAPKDGMLDVVGTVRHAGGHTEVFHRYSTADTSGPSGTRNKTDVQGSQSTVTYLTRRLLCAIFGVVILGEDKDGNKSYVVITETQAADLRALADEVKNEGETAADVIKKLCTYMKIDTLESLPAKSYQSAISAFEKRRVGASESKTATKARNTK